MSRVVEVYMTAWRLQDAELASTIFTEDAVYYESPLGEPIRTRHGIRDYWLDKVVGHQRNIECTLLALFMEGETAVAEWEAQFDDLESGIRKRIREVAILEFQGELISHLREYWTSQRLLPSD